MPEQHAYLLQTQVKKYKRRDRLVLLFEILEAAAAPVKKTHLLYRTRTNFYQISQYLRLLQDLGMIESVNLPFDGYRTTEKGRALLTLQIKLDYVSSVSGKS